MDREEINEFDFSWLYIQHISTWKNADFLEMEMDEEMDVLEYN